MVLTKNKKRPAETSPASEPHRKKQALPDVPLESDCIANGQNGSKTPKKLAKKSTSKKKQNRAFEVFVRKISKGIGKKKLKKHFSQFGNIKHVILPTKAEDNSAHKGFAFIEFADELGKKEALAAGLHEVNGQVVSVRDSGLSEPAPKGERNHTLRVFVKKIPKEIGKEELKKHFSQFGNINCVALPTKSEDGLAHVGFAYIEFTDELGKEEALAADQHEFLVNGQAVSVRVFDSSEFVSKKDVDKAVELYIRKIPKEVVKEDLKEYFSQFGNIKHIILPSKAEDNSAHKGFAFIEYADELGRKEALAAGLHMVNGQIVSVHDSGLSEPTSTKKRNRASRVFVKKIPKEIGKEELEKHFSQFGNINCVALPTKSEDGLAHVGVAYIEFTDELGKEEALAADHHKFLVNGQAVSVRVFDSSESASKEVNKALHLYVGKIPKEVVKGDLKEHFSQFGNMKHVILPTKVEDNSAHKGFAFIEFADELGKKEALAAGQHEVNGQVVFVCDSELSVSQCGERNATSQDTEEGQRVRLVAYGLAFTTTAQTVLLHFSHYGEVEHVKITRERGKLNSATVIFRDEESVWAALEEDHEIDFTPVTVKKANFPGFCFDDQVFE